MAKRSKRRRAPAPSAKSTAAPDTTLGTLGDALQPSEKHGPAPKGAARDQRPAPREATATAPTPTTTEHHRERTNEPSAVRDVTPEEFMRRAFEETDRVAFYDGKYQGIAPAPEGVRVAPAEAQSTASDPFGDAAPVVDNDDVLFFEFGGAGATPMEQRDKYAELREHVATAAYWPSEQQLAQLTNEDLHEPNLTKEQRALLRRSRKGGIEAYNIRHKTRVEALAEVEAFVRIARANGTRFVRIITGKGRNSEGPPVLKPALIAWCQSEGAPMVAHWAPETDLSGDYGSVVLQLRALTRG